MSSFAVQVVKIEDLEPIDGADRIELARIGGYRSVVPKGEYKVGELAVYIPEQAIIPQELLREIGLEGKLAGKEKNRVKAVKLRGSLSQGIVCRPQLYWHRSDPLIEDLYASGANIASALGITKWVPEVPANMAGEAYPCPELIRWIDIENVNRFPNVFTPADIVDVTEKIHGTAFCMTFVCETGEVHVTSKGLGTRGLALEESDRNLYWRAVKEYGLRDVLAGVNDLFIQGHNYQTTRIALFGEVYGAGVQDLQYGTSKPQFAAFDMFIEPKGDPGAWVSYDNLRDLLFHRSGVPLVPRLYSGPYDEELIWELASGYENVSNTKANIREGVVVRAMIDRHSDVLGGRAILKFVSPDYLTRKGPDISEFE